jgi:pyruvate dehydrogenase E1 component beta subunit
MRKLKFSAAINEAQHMAMINNSDIIQIGQGINSPFYVGQTMVGLLDRFGVERLIDTPLSESAITGMAIGAAITGLRPILTFPRMDFMYYSMDQICNHISTFNYSLGGNSPIPLLIRAIINRKGEQGAQHSQALHGLFMHIPGLTIIMPSNSFDAKGMFLAALEEENPVIFIEDSELYQEECVVPEEYYIVDLKKAKVTNEGDDITMVSSSVLLSKSKDALIELKKMGINVELIDLRIIKPIDFETILNSVKKTKKIIVVDGGWSTAGVASEIISMVAIKGIRLSNPPIKITLPDLPAPASSVLEEAYYPNTAKIITETLKNFNRNL